LLGDSCWGDWRRSEPTNHNLPLLPHLTLCQNLWPVSRRTDLAVWDTGTKTKEEQMTILKMLADAFHEGGWGMWPILTILMITISIVTERSVVLRKAVIDKDKLLALLRSQISAGNIQGAIKVCTGNPTPMTRIVQAGLMRANRSEPEIVAAMDEAALREMPAVEKRTGYCSVPSPASSKRSPVWQASTHRKRRPCCPKASPKP
jgi:hypothetical protein